jgi:hypothetical protein
MVGLLQSGTPGGVVELRSFETGELVGTILLLAPGRRDWLVTSPAGFFDGTQAAWDRGLWRFQDDTFQFAPIEIFFRNYYLPGLLPKILSGTLPEAPSLANINRTQPTVKIVRVESTPGKLRQQPRVRHVPEDSLSPTASSPAKAPARKRPRP